MEEGRHCWISGFYTKNLAEETEAQTLDKLDFWVPFLPFHWHQYLKYLAITPLCLLGYDEKGTYWNKNPM